MTLNECYLIGELTTEVSTSFANNGTQSASARLCVYEEGRNSEQIFKTYIPVQAWGHAATVLAECEKGALVLLRGKIKWQSAGELKDGQKPPGGLVVQAWQVQVLAPAEAVV